MRSAVVQRPDAGAPPIAHARYKSRAAESASALLSRASREGLVDRRRVAVAPSTSALLPRTAVAARRNDVRSGGRCGQHRREYWPRGSADRCRAVPTWALTTHETRRRRTRGRGQLRSEERMRSAVLQRPGVGAPPIAHARYKSRAAERSALQSRASREGLDDRRRVTRVQITNVLLS